MIILKRIKKNRLRWYKLHSAGSEQDPSVGNPTAGRNFLGHTSHYKLVKHASVPWSKLSQEAVKHTARAIYALMYILSASQGIKTHWNLSRNCKTGIIAHLRQNHVAECHCANSNLKIQATCPSHLLQLHFTVLAGDL
jgi:hypothetical protein